jgi:dihydropteroate synthase
MPAPHANVQAVASAGLAPPGAHAGSEADQRYVLDCRGRPLDCRPGRPAHVVGVLNVTPDSFSDGGAYATVAAALVRAREMADEGAAVIDVGGESTRPAGAAYGRGAEAVPPAVEIERVVPVIEGIARDLPHVLISIDTYKGEVARAALRAGAHIVNDVGGVREGVATARAAADYGAPLVVMHSVGHPGAFPDDAGLTDVVSEVVAGLERSVRTAVANGVRHVIVDPGFGFGKGTTANLLLLRHLETIVAIGRPVLVGLSRKRTAGVVASGDEGAPAPVLGRLFASLGLAAAAVCRGAMLVRAHDVAATSEVLRALGAAAAAGESHG